MFSLDAVDDGALPSKWHLQPVQPQDFEAMLAIRIEALRPSLERLDCRWTHGGRVAPGAQPEVRQRVTV